MPISLVLLLFWGKMRHRNTWHWHPQQSWDVCSNCCLDKLGNQPTCPFSDVILLHRLIAGHKGIKMTPYWPYYLMLDGGDSRGPPHSNPSFLTEKKCPFLLSFQDEENRLKNRIFFFLQQKSYSYSSHGSILFSPLLSIILYSDLWGIFFQPFGSGVLDYCIITVRLYVA